MATSAQVAAADTGSPTYRAKIAREIARRRRNTEKGVWRDNAILPVTFAATEPTPDEVSSVIRTLFWQFGRRPEERAQMLSMLLGE